MAVRLHNEDGGLIMAVRKSAVWQVERIKVLLGWEVQGEGHYV
jgi:hypothetical protein